MRKIIPISVFLVLLMGSVSVVKADMIDITGDNVSYKVNVGTMYVGSSALDKSKSANGVNQQASASYSNNQFTLSVSSTGSSAYTDAGILIGFDGSLTLGELQSLTFSSSAPISLSIWLDTGGNGSTGGPNGAFLQFNNGVWTGSYNGDTTMGTGVLANNTLTSGTSLNMYTYLGQTGQSGTYTLAQLQSGAVSGIDANTLVAIWIGISTSSGTKTATISNVELDPVPEPSLPALLGIGIGAVGLLIGLSKRTSIAKWRGMNEG
jgi:hypothetical protein